MKLEYKTTDKDYLDFYEFNALNTPRGQKALRVQKMSVPVILCIVLLCTLMFSVKPMFIMIQAVIYIAGSWMWFKNVDRNIRKSGQAILQKMILKGQKPYSARGIITFGENEINDLREDNQTLTLYYTDITTVYEYHGAFYLYMSQAGRVILLPASVFREEGSREEFVQLLKQKIAPEEFKSEG